MVGDGLTQIRAKQFSDLIKESSASYGPCHETTMMIQKAIDQVIFIPGDLHGGGFHIMQVVYNLFYGAIIQKIQTILQWKRICGSDVSKCYQQAASLAYVLATEMECQITLQIISKLWMVPMKIRQRSIKLRIQWNLRSTSPKGTQDG